MTLKIMQAQHTERPSLAYSLSGSIEMFNCNDKLQCTHFIAEFSKRFN